jgi:molybdopterin-binding protein
LTHEKKGDAGHGFYQVSASKFTISQKYWRMPIGERMKISARNTLKGTVKEINPGVVNTEVVIAVAPGAEVVSVITIASCERLGLEVGKEVYALVKATDMMLAVD